MSRENADFHIKVRKERNFPSPFGLLVKLLRFLLPLVQINGNVLRAVFVKFGEIGVDSLHESGVIFAGQRLQLVNISYCGMMVTAQGIIMVLITMPKSRLRPRNRILENT